MESLMYYILVTAVTLALLFTPIIVLVIKGWKKPILDVPCPMMIVMGSGGHTTEMLTIVSQMEPRLYTPRIYVMAESDRLSREKIVRMEEERQAPGTWEIVTVHRIREVGQSWTSTILQSLPISLIQSFEVIKKYRPYVILNNGPGLCVPICICARLFRFLSKYNCRVIFVESVARVRRLSLTGWILQFAVDFFFVQWPELMEMNPNFRYIGGRIC